MLTVQFAAVFVIIIERRKDALLWSFRSSRTARNPRRRMHARAFRPRFRGNGGRDARVLPRPFFCASRWCVHSNYYPSRIIRMLFLRRTIIIYHRRILSSQVRERQNAKKENDARRTLPVACMDWDMISVSFLLLGGFKRFCVRVRV